MTWLNPLAYSFRNRSLPPGIASSGMLMVSVACPVSLVLVTISVRTPSGSTETDRSTASERTVPVALTVRV